MDYFVNLIEVEAGQNPSVTKILKDNCTHIEDHYWIVKGSAEYLRELGVVFVITGIGYISSPWGMPRLERIAMCNKIFGTDIQPRN